MDKIIKNKWEEFLFQEGIDYSTNDIYNKIKKSIDYLRKQHLRVDVSIWNAPEEFNMKYRLSNEDICKYTIYFQRKQFDNKSIEKIILCLKTIYHTFEISQEEAVSIVEYASENRYTLTKAIKDKLSVDLQEINEFLNEVMTYNAIFCMKKASSYGNEIIRVLTALI